MRRLTRWAEQNLRLLLAMLCLCLALLVLLWTAGQMEECRGWNRSIRQAIEEFDPDSREWRKSDLYQSRIPMEQMDMSEYDFLVDSLVGFAPNLPAWTWELTEDLVYYRQSDGKKLPALTLEKGMAVSWRRDAVFGGYGFFTFPTYERGWRYAVPFAAEEELSGWEKGVYVLPQTEYEYYYVRLEDLKAVLAASYRQVDEIDAELTGRDTKITLLFLDKSLARYHTFVSNDLRASVSPMQYLPQFTGVLALLLLAGACLFPQFKREKAVCL